MKTSYSIYAGAIALLAVSACGGHADGWSLEGEMPESAGSLYVEAPANGGRWYVVDSVSSAGAFRLEVPRPAHSTIMRLRSGRQVAYFPVDSTEALTFNSVDFTVEGTEGADIFARVDKIIRSGFSGDNMDAEADAKLKRQLLETLSGHYDSHAAYYVVRKEIDGRRVIDPVANDADFKLMRAVANAFSGLRPDDPRTRQLVADYVQIEALRRSDSGQESRTLEITVPEIGYYDISLPDAKGNMRSLSSVVEANKVTVLNFMDYSDPEAGLLNALLGTAYEKFSAQGLQIYQVGVDFNAHVWSNVAVNKPWVSVYQSESAPGSNLLQYGVSAFPVTFILTADGVQKRVDDLNELLSELKPYM